MDSLRNVPAYVVAPVLVILAVTVIYVVLKALREGREVSFWPPKIGPRQNSEGVDGRVQKSANALPAQSPDPSSAASAAPGTAARDVTQTAKFPANALALLFVQSGPIAGMTFVLTASKQSYLFGHNASCDFDLPDVSRAQFRIHIRRRPGPSLQPYMLEVQGTGSRIELWVDGVSAGGLPIPLNENSVIETGGLKILVVKLPS